MRPRVSGRPVGVDINMRAKHQVERKIRNTRKGGGELGVARVSKIVNPSPYDSG